jgi:hypothetical protein
MARMSVEEIQQGAAKGQAVNALCQMAHDEHLAAIKAHRALESELKTESTDVDQELNRASANLQRKQETYLRATDDLRSLGSQQ